MSNSPGAALAALRELPGVLSLIAINLRHATDVDDAHGGQTRLLESQAAKLENLMPEVRAMADGLAPAVDPER